MIAVPREDFGVKIAHEKIPEKTLEATQAKALDLYGGTLGKY